MLTNYTDFYTITSSVYQKDMFDIQQISTTVRSLFTRKDILLICILIVAYFATRLINLDQFPIFSDEGIYIHWAKIAWHDATWRFISLTDGKQPLQTWGTIPFLKLFPDNALLAGRLFSVSTGFIALSGVFSFLYYLWGKRAAFWGAFFYILTPYFIFYDRISLVDSGVNAGFIWILFFSILLARQKRLDVALLLGMIGGISLLAKSNVRIFLGLAAFAPIIYFSKNIKKFVHESINYYLLFGLTVFISLVIYNVQRLSPFLHFVAEKNQTFVMTFAEFKQNPFALFWENLPLVPLYSFWEAAFVLPILAIIGLIFLYKKDRRLSLYFLIWIIIPYTVVTFLSKIIFPRYIIFFASIYLILATYYIISVKNKTLLYISIGLFVLSVGYFNYTLLFDYKNIPFPPVDRGQYIEGWPAGWGMKEIMNYSREKSKEKPVIILADGNFGLSADVLDTFMKDGDQISIQGLWPLTEQDLLNHQKDLKDHYVYIVLAHTLDYPHEWPMTLVKQFDKPNNQSRIFLFQLKE